jgi:hypothetical protein
MIDAFGHSVANAALFHDMGFEATVFTRADSRMKHMLEKNE